MIRNTRAALAATALAASMAVVPAAALAQAGQQPRTTTQTGTSGGIDGRNVSVSTYGSGESRPTGTTVDGGGDATAVDGSASTQTNARANERRAMQRSVATATSEDARARSRTHTMVLPNQTVRSTTTTMYKERGEQPVRETERSVVRPGQ